MVSTTLRFGVALACASALVPAGRLRRRSSPLRASGAPTVYPPLAEADIEALFTEVPVFTLANEDGYLALLNDGKTKACEFYVDVDVAVQRKQFWDDSGKLSVTVQSLGKALAAYGGGGDGSARFVASPEELSQARGIFVRCATGGEPPEDPQELLAAYNDVDPGGSFAEPTDVPLFCIDALRLSAAEPAPWYFSMKDLLETWEAAGGTREAAYDRVKIVNLREMVRLLQAKTPTPKPGLFLAGMANLEAVGRK